MTVLARWRRWYAGVRAGGVYGRALGRFYQRRYEDAAVLFERAERLDPDHARVHFNHALQGRCYCALGRNKDALELLSRAYGPYCDCAQRESFDSHTKRDFVDFLDVFSHVLLRTGKADRAEQVALQASDFRRRRGIA